MSFSLSVEADDDLDSIVLYIGRDSVEAARRWGDRLLAEISFLGQTPSAGHTRQDLTSAACLFWSVSTYLIMYRVLGPEMIQVIAITQGSRDLPRLLQQRGYN